MHIMRSAIKKSRWLCGVVTVPDGRILAYRIVLSAGPTLWSAMLNMACFGTRNESVVVRRLVNDKYGAWVAPKNVKHILSHSRNTSLYHGAFDSDIDVYHLKFPEMVEFELAEGIETIALPFDTIVADLRSGAWQEQSVIVFNILDVQCKREFQK